jgi:phosphatidylglycerol:prolipoprotein diacylglycerol transferase
MVVSAAAAGPTSGPMNRQQADDLVFYATLGVILGGRLGYVIFYGPEMIFDPCKS